jgi:hypothetical protein
MTSLGQIWLMSAVDLADINADQSTGQGSRGAIGQPMDLTDRWDPWVWLGLKQKEKEEGSSSWAQSVGLS